MNPISESGLEVAGNDGMQTYNRQLNQSMPLTTHDQKENGQASRRNRYLMCGLGTLPFVLLVGFVAFILGGALGGGLGAGLSRSSAHGTSTCSFNAGTTRTSFSSLPSSTPTALPVSNYSVVPYRNVTSFANECPSLSTSTYVDAYDQSYTFSCGLVYAPGAAADPEYGYVIGDLASALTYSVNDCTLLCTLWNTDASIPHSTTCRGVSWVPEVNTAFKDFGANCVLKNATGPGTSYISPYIVSAKLG